MAEFNSSEQQTSAQEVTPAMSKEEGGRSQETGSGYNRWPISDPSPYPPVFLH